MTVEIDNPAHLADFIRLNEMWIAEHFAIEAADRALAADPHKIIDDGGHVISLVAGGCVVGVCALFREDQECFELARLAVEPAERGRGHGDTLMSAALALARQHGARRVVLLTNTLLQAALGLYLEHGFRVVSEGPHPVYARCNLVMERRL